MEIIFQSDVGAPEVYIDLNPKGTNEEWNKRKIAGTYYKERRAWDHLLPYIENTAPYNNTFYNFWEADLNQIKDEGFKLMGSHKFEIRTKLTENSQVIDREFGINFLNTYYILEIDNPNDIPSNSPLVIRNIGPDESEAISGTMSSLNSLNPGNKIRNKIKVLANGFFPNTIGLLRYTFGIETELLQVNAPYSELEDVAGQTH